ncbi:MAG: hypothetical protein CO108_06135 [Deltaproteobacteria bacterium CG_4_9_14_3_um_filter_63_12]|nr:MAG: hypothetical protein CO108_06135 [Deltaproteobacteria bacterium CG_4_9_14_3_um_filter_63_12]
MAFDVNVVERHDEYLEARQAWGFDEIIRYRRGLLMLFHGKPGTGKTVYLEELGEFILVAPHLKQATETALDFDDDDVECDVLKRLHEAAPSESILHLEIETSGMACGPVESTLYIGFDFAPPVS